MKPTIDLEPVSLEEQGSILQIKICRDRCQRDLNLVR